MKKFSNSRRRTQNPRLGGRLFAFLVETRWFFIGAAVLFLIVALSGFDKRDVGWSRAEGLAEIQNPAGFVGAWLSDLLFYLFGHSAWWWVGLLLMIIWRAIKEPLKETSWVSRSALGAGFLLLLLGSCTLEAMRFYRFGGDLPALGGGLVGTGLGGIFNQLFGYGASTLILLLVLAMGWRLFSSMSWLDFFERIGAFFEKSPLAHVLNLFQGFAHQKEELSRPKEEPNLSKEPSLPLTSPFAPELASANNAPLNVFSPFKPTKAENKMEKSSIDNAGLFHWAKNFPKDAPLPEVKIQLGEEEKLSLQVNEISPPQALKPLAQALQDDSPFSGDFWKSKHFAQKTPFDAEEKSPPPFEIVEEKAPVFGISIPKPQTQKSPPAFLKIEKSPDFSGFGDFVLPETKPEQKAKESLDLPELNLSSPFPPLPELKEETAPLEWKLEAVEENIPELPIVEKETLPADFVIEDAPLTLNDSFTDSFSDFPAEEEVLTAEKEFQKKSPLTVEKRPAFSTHFAQAHSAFKVRVPSVNLLDPVLAQSSSLSEEDLRITSQLIEQRLKEFGVLVKVVNAISGPVVTRFEIEPAMGVKGAQVVNLAKDLARALAVASIRVVETIPGKAYMALELPNPKRQMVHLKEIICSAAFTQSSSKLTVSLGKDIAGISTVANLAKMPHLLVAGTTGSGKSVGVNAMILSLLYKSTPEDVRLIMVDPKMLELSIYEGIPHLLTPVVTDMKEAANALSWCVAEMERRYKLMSALGVRNIEGLNQKILDARAVGEALTNPFSITPESPEPLEKMPFIVVIIDELADLMMVAGKKVEELIARLAQKARAAGIHLILATQRPSVDVITGLIKANIPTRIAFQVSSKIDSRTILEQMGAEALLGQGDMLYLAPGTGTPQRVHGAFVSDNEVHRVVNYLKSFGPPQYVEDVLNVAEEEGAEKNGGEAEKDPFYDQAVENVIKAQRVSISKVQRDFGIGYNRASRMVEAMEAAGVVSEPDRRGNREVLLKRN